MKKFVLVLLSCVLTSTLLFAKSKENIPAFDGGTVIDLSELKGTFKDNILLTNYSSAERAKFEFYFYSNDKDSWKKAGEGDLSAFASEAKAYKKPGQKRPKYVAYKTNLSDDFRIVPFIENHDLKLHVFDSCASFAGTKTPFDDIAGSQEQGIIKVGTASLRANYEDNLRVVDAPNCLIYYTNVSTGKWDVFGAVRGGRLWTNYHDDIDEIEPYWIVQIVAPKKDYSIETYARFDDLYLKFVKADSMLAVKRPVPIMSHDETAADGSETLLADAAVKNEDSSENESISAEGIYETPMYSSSAPSESLFIEDDETEDRDAESDEDEDTDGEDESAGEKVGENVSGETESESDSVVEDAVEPKKPESELESAPVIPAAEEPEKVKRPSLRTGALEYHFGDGDLAEDLLKLKEFYDAGLIDEDEYKLKKAQLLGL